MLRVTRQRKDIVQARSLDQILERTLAVHQNRAMEASQVIEELIELARDMREANASSE